MTAQTKPQALPATGEDDADRRARETIATWLATGGAREGTAGEMLQNDFAEAIRAAVEAEREGCAKMVDGHGRFCKAEAQSGGSPSLYERADGAFYLAKRIRARGEAS